jgi:5,10-methylenetetrahydrofolate reductase
MNIDPVKTAADLENILEFASSQLGGFVARNTIPAATIQAMQDEITMARTYISDPVLWPALCQILNNPQAMRSLIQHLAETETLPPGETPIPIGEYPFGSSPEIKRPPGWQGGGNSGE